MASCQQSQPHGISCLRITIIPLLLGMFAYGIGQAQSKVTLQVKTFDQKLQPMKNLEIAINDLEFFLVGNRGTAITELDQSEIPIRSIKVNDEKLEAASWNLSRGIVEIIIRPKSYKVLHFVLRLPDETAVPNVPVVFNSSTTISATSDENGKFDLPVALNESIPSADQFSVQDFVVTKVSHADQENVLTITRPVTNAAPHEAVEIVSRPSEKQEAINPAIVDSIRSLAIFYSVFRNISMGSLSQEDRERIDAKFNELMALKEDSIIASQSLYIRRISDSSQVAEDIGNLLNQATVESNALLASRADFENKIDVISSKLERGVFNLTREERVSLLQDIDRLEQLLTVNESRFYQNHNDYREIINALKEKYFDIQTLETRLTETERQRQHEQKLFRQRMIGVGGIVIVFGLLIILLISFYTRLRRQAKSLAKANERIEQINENLEAMVARRTRLLEEANKELDTFLYKASHDLRAPVRSIIGLCQIIEHIPLSEMVERVEGATETMDRVLNKLIDISEIGQESMNLETVELAKVINEVRNKQLVMTNGLNVRNNQPTKILKRPVQFNVDCTKDLKLYASPTLLEIILTNLVENAIFFSGLKKAPEHARVEIKAVAKDEQVELSVYDNGVGISESIRPRLFNMFFTGHEESKGNGLGLYAVHKSVLAMHGRITVESEEGRYTRFVVVIPRTQGEHRRALAASFASNDMQAR